MGIRHVRIKYENILMQLPNVIGVSIGEKAGKEVIKVFVTRKAALQPQEVVPKMLEGYATDVEELGSLTAQTN